MNRHHAFVVLAAIVLMAGCDSGTSTTTTGEQHLRAQPTTAKVARRDITGYLLIDGHLYTPPNRDVIVKAPYASNVDQVLVKQGDHVDKGETIVKMQLPEMQQYFQQAKSTVDAAHSAYSSALAQYGSAYKQAQLALDQARAAERSARQSASSTGDATALNDAIAARQSAEQALIQAKADRDSQVLPYKQQLDQAEAAYRDAKAGVRQANVTAPISGTVVDLNTQAGAAVDNNTVVAHIVDLSDIQVKANITPEQASYVDKDKSCIVIFNGLEDKPFNGEVTNVQTIPAGGGAVKREVTVDFSNDHGLVKPGMTVKSIGIKVGQVHDVLAVPADAVYQDANGRASVRVMNNGQWSARLVETGLTDGFFTEIKSGLSEGDEVRVTLDHRRHHVRRDGGRLPRLGGWAAAGGADILLLETQNDTRTIKAALIGIWRLFEEIGRRLPIMVSATIELNGHDARRAVGRCAGGFAAARRPAVARAELLDGAGVHDGPPAQPRRADGVPDVRLAERRPARRRGLLQRDAGAHGRGARAVHRPGLAEHHRRLLRHDVRAHARLRGDGRRQAAARRRAAAARRCSPASTSSKRTTTTGR